MLTLLNNWSFFLIMPLPLSPLHVLISKKSTAVLWTCNAISLFVLWHMLPSVYLSGQKKKSYFFFKPYLSFVFSVVPSLTQHSMLEWATIVSLLSSAILSLLYLSYSITISDSKVNEDSLTEGTQYYFVYCNRTSNNVY